MASDWIMVRLRRETHASLEAVRLSMLLGDSSRRRPLEYDDRDRVGLDKVIAELVAFRTRHAARRKASAARRRRRAAGQEVPNGQ